MLNIERNLKKIFDSDDIIEGEVLEVVEVNEQPQPATPAKYDVTADDDYKEARTNIKNLLSTGEDALDMILEIAKESEQPRAFEIVATMMKQLSDMNHQLVDLHEKKKRLKKDIKEEPVGGNTTVTNNAIFVGTTTSLNKMIEEQLLKQKEI
jgi:hypothetical protein